MKRSLAIIFLIATALRLTCVFTLQPLAIQPDSGEYLTIARNVVTGNGFALAPGEPASKRLPLYPGFLALCMALGLGSTLAVGIVQAVIGSLLCLLVWQTARIYFDDRTAIFAAFATAAYPVLCAYTPAILTETLFTFFIAWAVAALAAALNSRAPLHPAAAGILAGAAVLVRPDILLLPLAAVVLIPLSAGSFRPAFRNTGLYLAGLIIAVSPWMVRNYAVFGTMVPANVGGLGRVVWSSAHYADRGSTEYDAATWNSLHSYYNKTYGDVDPGHIEGRLFTDGVSMITRQPGRFLSLFVRRFPAFWLTSHSALFGIDKPNRDYLAGGRYGILAAKALLLALQCFLLALAAGGMVLALARRRGKQLLLLFFMALYPSLYLFLDAPGRHHVPFMPYLILWASYAAADIMRRFRRGASA